MSFTVLSGRPVHVLSIDVEEHFQVSAFWSPMRRRHWDQFESRVERNTRKISNLLASQDMKATFFVLGWVAERHPALVKYLDECGHEIASHGYGHELITVQTQEVFREDVRRSKRILEDLIGKPVIGYRAPSFSITAETSWALSILAEERYVYDSSIYHKFKDRYKEPTRPGSCYLHQTSSGSIWEVPPSTLKVVNVHIPVAGGGYFRLLPYPAIRAALKRLEGQGGQLVMYLHPWEIDPEQPRMKGPLLSQFRHYLNLSKTETRLRSLLADFSFGPINQVMDPVRHAIETGQHGSRVFQNDGRSVKASPVFLSA